MQATMEPKRWVVKLGSRVVVLREGRGPDGPFLKELARQARALRERDYELVIVTSGAIATGLSLLGWKRRPPAIAKQQAIAALGQIALMDAYRDAFANEGLTVAQVLLTHEDFRHRERFLNARQTIKALIELGAVPLINENDTVATEEIKVGDNDNLAAMVACLWEADLLVLLSDVDGFYTADPRLKPDAERISVVENLDAMEAFAAPTPDPAATGGMRTKLEAARRAASYAIPTVIARGREPDVLVRLAQGERLGTLIRPKAKRLTARKHWIAYALRPRGSIAVDEGAYRAVVEEGRSLLPSGVMGVEGDFQRGDAVELRTPDGRAFARGLAAYGAHELRRIQGKRTDEIERVLGYKYRDEVVHRDDLVLLEEARTP